MAELPQCIDRHPLVRAVEVLLEGRRQGLLRLERLEVADSAPCEADDSERVKVVPAARLGAGRYQPVARRLDARVAQRVVLRRFRLLLVLLADLLREQPGCEGQFREVAELEIIRTHFGKQQIADA